MDSLQPVIGTQDYAQFVNDSLGLSKRRPHEMGRDEFLQILITQLQNQDPTAPVEDKEFIAQMAQFSTLEQMTGMRNEFSQLSQSLQATQALNLLGHEVVVTTDGETIQGSVSAVQTDGMPRVQVQGRFYPLSNVSIVNQNERKAPI